MAQLHPKQVNVLVCIGAATLTLDQVLFSSGLSTLLELTWFRILKA